MVRAETASAGELLARARVSARNNRRAHEDYINAHFRAGAFPAWIDDIEATRPSAGAAARRAFARAAAREAQTQAPGCNRTASRVEPIPTNVQNWCSSDTNTGDTGWFS